LSHTSSPFCCSYFRDGVSRNICPGWSQTMTLLTSASQVARIIDVPGCIFVTRIKIF
jgi:hypothetical protein